MIKNFSTILIIFFVTRLIYISLREKLIPHFKKFNAHFFYGFIALGIALFFSIAYPFSNAIFMLVSVLSAIALDFFATGYFRSSNPTAQTDANPLLFVYALIVMISFVIVIV